MLFRDATGSKAYFGKEQYAIISFSGHTVWMPEAEGEIADVYFIIHENTQLSCGSFEAQLCGKGLLYCHSGWNPARGKVLDL